MALHGEIKANAQVIATWEAVRTTPDPPDADSVNQYNWVLTWRPSLGGNPLQQSEPDREVDRLIGVRLYLAGLGQWAGPTADFVPPQSLADYAVKGLSDEDVERFTAAADEPQTDECPIRLGRGEL